LDHGVVIGNKLRAKVKGCGRYRGRYGGIHVKDMDHGEREFSHHLATIYPTRYRSPDDSGVVAAMATASCHSLDGTSPLLHDRYV